MKATFTMSATTGAVTVKGRAAIYDQRAEWTFTGLPASMQLRLVSAIKAEFPSIIAAFNPETETSDEDGVVTFYPNLATDTLRDRMGTAGLAVLVSLVDTAEGGEGHKLTAEITIEPAPNSTGAAVEDVEGALTQTEADLLYAAKTAFQEHTTAHPAPTSRDTRNEEAGVAASIMNAHTDAHPIPTERDERNEGRHGGGRGIGTQHRDRGSRSGGGRPGGAGLGDTR